eukprot:11224992-Lingulodinium_polyedra.AAC.1
MSAAARARAPPRRAGWAGRFAVCRPGVGRRAIAGILTSTTDRVAPPIGKLVWVWLRGQKPCCSVE